MKLSKKQAQEVLNKMTGLLDQISTYVSFIHQQDFERAAIVRDRLLKVIQERFREI